MYGMIVEERMVISNKLEYGIRSVEEGKGWSRPEKEPVECDLKQAIHSLINPIIQTLKSFAKLYTYHLASWNKGQVNSVQPIYEVR